VLKGLITELILVVEGKGKPVITVKNMLHLILAANADWVVPASTRERRYAVWNVPDTRCGDFAYFKAIDEQMKDTGLAGLIHDLLHRDISQFQVRAVPQTEALAQQKLLSLPSVERWWLAVLSRRYLYQSRHGAPYFRSWHEFYSTELLNRSYVQWCEENRPFDRRSREQIGRFFSEVYQDVRPSAEHPIYELDSIPVSLRDFAGADLAKELDKVSIVRQDRPRGYLVGTLEEARARFLDCRNVPAPWQQADEETE
jgi:hypothetical protein